MLLKKQSFEIRLLTTSIQQHLLYEVLAMIVATYLQFV